MAARAEEADSARQKLVYVGHVDAASGKCTVSLKVSHAVSSGLPQVLACIWELHLHAIGIPHAPDTMPSSALPGSVAKDNCVLHLIKCHMITSMLVSDLCMRPSLLILQAYAKEHPFAQLSGSDNVIAFFSRRYSPQPLIIR